ncbi:hypothetical protein [Microbispora hainanensis]|uniref:hypothetical protein n=1 Tax=Microbispora hainanensis TaxID=568844 RepID=UPI00142F1A44|nr:hypothetical protein [Microbispora hainanensis]
MPGMLLRVERKIVRPGSGLRRTSRGVGHGHAEHAYDQGCRRRVDRRRVGAARVVA